VTNTDQLPLAVQKWKQLFAQEVVILKLSS